jgi:hypothetical protein
MLVSVYTLAGEIIFVRAKNGEWQLTVGLCDVGEIEAQMFNLGPKFIRIPMLKFSTNAPLLQNPCCMQAIFRVLQQVFSLSLLQYLYRFP